MSTTTKVVDLTPALVNILLHRGDGWVIPFQFKPGGVAADLSDYTIKAQIRDHPDSAEATELVVTKTDAAAGRFTVSQPAAGVLGYYDIEFKKNDDPPRTYIAGLIKVGPDVTPRMTDTTVEPDVVEVVLAPTPVEVLLAPPAPVVVELTPDVVDVVITPETIEVEVGAGMVVIEGPDATVELFDSTTVPASPPDTYLRFERDDDGDVQAVYLGTVD